MYIHVEYMIICIKQCVSYLYRYVIFASAYVKCCVSYQCRTMENIFMSHHHMRKYPYGRQTEIPGQTSKCICLMLTVTDYLFACDLCREGWWVPISSNSPPYIYPLNYRAFYNCVCVCMGVCVRSSPSQKEPRLQGLGGKHGAHLGPVGPR